MLSNFCWLQGAFKLKFLQKRSSAFFEAFTVYEEILFLYLGRRKGVLSKCTCPSFLCHPFHTSFKATPLYQNTQVYNSGIQVLHKYTEQLIWVECLISLLSELLAKVGASQIRAPTLPVYFYQSCLPWTVYQLSILFCLLVLRTKPWGSKILNLLWNNPDNYLCLNMLVGPNLALENPNY